MIGGDQGGIVAGSIGRKLGIDWQAKKAEFEAYLKEVEAGHQETLYDPRLMITSGPGFKPIERVEKSGAP